LLSEQLTDRKTVRRQLAEAGVRPSKRLGQSFLVEPGVLDAIRDVVSDAQPERIVEIGAGLGAVTKVLASLAQEVIALEIDARLVDTLTRNVGGLPSVAVCHEDALDYCFPDASEGGKAFVVGSIPYAITAPILQRLVAHRAGISAAVLLTQREVAEKIAASPGPSGSALGVLVRAHADVQLLRRVGRGSFFPVPEVDSTLWMMRFLESARFRAGAETFFAMVRAIYGVRRKMIRAALRPLASREQLAEAFKAAGIEETVRGETLGFAELDRLACAFEAAGLPLRSPDA
jgi:16S rRNA (adenine1518-N6/adenine1519-N6)-dimethyltransferase